MAALKYAFGTTFWLMNYESAWRRGSTHKCPGAADCQLQEVFQTVEITPKLMKLLPLWLGAKGVWFSTTALRDLGGANFFFFWIRGGERERWERDHSAQSLFVGCNLLSRQITIRWLKVFLFISLWLCSPEGLVMPPWPAWTFLWPRLDLDVWLDWATCGHHNGHEYVYCKVDPEKLINILDAGFQISAKNFSLAKKGSSQVLLTFFVSWNGYFICQGWARGVLNFIKKRSKNIKQHSKTFKKPSLCKSPYAAFLKAGPSGQPCDHTEPGGGCGA